MIERVGEILRAAAAQEIIPRFQKLRAGDISEKAPGEMVTVADRAAEALITRELGALMPHAVVVGEEATAADPSLMKAVGGPGPVFVVDPLDGTRNFIAGKPIFAVMAALLTGGVARAAWILRPIAGDLTIAEEGSGAFFEDRPLHLAAAGADPADWSVAIHSTMMPPAMRRHADAARPHFANTEGQYCAGFDHVDVACGKRQGAVFSRTLPWDHAPGELIVREAGGAAGRFDGAAYDPPRLTGGLITASDPATWRRLRDMVIA
jgi:fructose-1,6-bisphosphatase/inositol monophosphatase family enzyme